MSDMIDDINFDILQICLVSIVTLTYRFKSNPRKIKNFMTDCDRTAFAFSQCLEVFNYTVLSIMTYES